MRNITVVLQDNKEVEIDCDDELHSGMRYYRDVFEALAMYVGGGSLAEGRMITRDQNGMNLDEEIDFSENHMRLYIKSKQNRVKVTHDGKVTHLNLPVGATLQTFRKQYLEKEGEELNCDLSINGVQLDDGPVIMGDNSEEEEISVVGVISVVVVDPEVNVEDLQLSVYEFTTIAQLKKQYCEKARREHMLGAEILANNSSSEMRKEFDGTMTIHDAGLTHGNYVVFKGCAFIIRITELGDKSQSEELTVYDHWTVEKIKAEYSKRADEGLVDGDRLVFNDQELNEDSQIYKYRMKDNSLVLVDREDFSQQQFLYQCVDCGNEVRLKKEDMIKCRTCGYRIVYKARTLEPSQYMAR